MRRLISPTTLVLILASGSIQAAGDPVSGKNMAQDCTACHGENGLGDGETPRIAGLDATYIIAELRAFKSGERIDDNELMPFFAENLSEQDMADLAAHFSTLDAD